MDAERRAGDAQQAGVMTGSVADFGQRRPAVLVHGDKLFISYSASATDENYCMGLLWIDLNADPQNPANWHKSPHPVFVTSYENRQ